MQNKNHDGRTIICHGPYYENVQTVIHNDYSGRHGSTDIAPTLYDLNDVELMREVLTPVVKLIQSGRQWFALYRVMVDGNYLSQGSYTDFERRLRTIYNGRLPIEVDAHELAKLEVDCFAKPFSQWTVEHAPVQGNTYRRYHNIAQMASEILGVEY